MTPQAASGNQLTRVDTGPSLGGSSSTRRPRHAGSRGALTVNHGFAPETIGYVDVCAGGRRRALTNLTYQYFDDGNVRSGRHRHEYLRELRARQPRRLTTWQAAHSGGSPQPEI